MDGLVGCWCCRPFERSVEDNKSLYHHLMRIEQLACQVSSELLERLSTVACSDSLAGSGYQGQYNTYY